MLESSPNHLPAPQSMEKLSSTKQISGAEKEGPDAIHLLSVLPPTPGSSLSFGHSTSSVSLCIMVAPRLLVLRFLLLSNYILPFRYLFQFNKFRFLNLDPEESQSF